MNQQTRKDNGNLGIWARLDNNSYKQVKGDTNEEPKTDEWNKSIASRWHIQLNMSNLQ